MWCLLFDKSLGTSYIFALFLVFWTYSWTSQTYFLKKSNNETNCWRKLGLGPFVFVFLFQMVWRLRSWREKSKRSWIFLFWNLAQKLKFLLVSVAFRYRHTWTRDETYLDANEPKTILVITQKDFSFPYCWQSVFFSLNILQFMVF